MAFFALLAIRLGLHDHTPSLPHVWNGRFKATIWLGPVPGVGRSDPVERCRRANAYSRPSPVYHQRQQSGSQFSTWQTGLSLTEIARANDRTNEQEDNHDTANDSNWCRVAF